MRNRACIGLLPLIAFGRREVLGWRVASLLLGLFLVYLGVRQLWFPRDLPFAG